MGCVSYTQRFFGDRRFDRKRLREAQIAAAKEIELIAHDYQRLGWKEAVGSSGSARAIADVLEMNNLNPNGETGITREGLDRLCALLIKAGSAEVEFFRSTRGVALAGLHQRQNFPLPLVVRRRNGHRCHQQRCQQRRNQSFPVLHYFPGYRVDRAQMSADYTQSPQARRASRFSLLPAISARYIAANSGFRSSNPEANPLFP